MQGAPQAGSQEPSAMLQRLSQLSVDTWAQVLLPKLIDQGSAADLSLTCSQLRDLCYSSRQRVNLGTLPDSTGPSNLKAWVQSLPVRFQNCSEVSLELKSDNSYHGMPYILPALARLPQLQELSMTLTGSQQPLAVCSMLFTMRTQLPKLQALAFSISAPNTWVPEAQEAFQELGGMTQLTRLSLKLKDTEDTNPLRDAGIGHLSALKELQHLAIQMEDWDVGERLQQFYNEPAVLPAQLLSGFTALTRLETNLGSRQILQGVNSCVQLQHLAVCVASQPALGHLPAEDWACLSSLTRLTQLRLLGASLIEATPEATQVLGTLPKLQTIAADVFALAFLPALRGCAQLTEICGRLQPGPAYDDEDDLAECVLPQILTLSPGSWTPSMELFPNLRHVRVDDFHAAFPYRYTSALCAWSMQSLCKHCTGLRELVLTAGVKILTSSFTDNDHLMRIEEPIFPDEFEDCTAALQALTCLLQLTCIKFSPANKYELLALVRTCSVLQAHSLQELHVVEGQLARSSLSAAAWAQLGQLRGLRMLSVQICSDTTQQRLKTEAVVFLGALSSCRRVVLQLPGHLSHFEDALSDLAMAGVPAPNIKLVRVVPVLPADW